MSQNETSVNEPTTDASTKPETLVDLVFDLGTEWAAHGLDAAGHALELSARTLEKAAQSLETVRKQLLSKV